MEVQLTADQKALARQAMEAGRIHHETEVVQEALSLWENRERARLEIPATLDIAEASLARGEGRVITGRSMVDLANEAKQRGRVIMQSAILISLLIPIFSISQSSNAQSTAPSLEPPGETTRFAQPTPMQPERSEDAYTIYSQLLKSGPIEWRDVSRKQWLIEETTNAVPLDSACLPGPGSNSMSMNPHTAVQAPAERQPEWNEVLTDYDRHCHDVIKLDSQSFKTELPVHLLNAEDKRSFQKSPRQPPVEFEDGAGLHRFTEVFFNTNHTLALVEQGMWCGTECGNWTWVVLERRDRQWKVLPWVHTFTVS